MKFRNRDKRTRTGKTEPDAFTAIRARTCVICGELAVRHRSDYPSLVEPFAAREVLWCCHCGGGFVPGAAKMLSSFYEVEYADNNRGDRDISPGLYFSKRYREENQKLGKYFRRARRQLGIMEETGVEMDRILDFGSGPGYLLWLSRAKSKFAFEPDRMSKKYLDFIGAQTLTSMEDFGRDMFDGVIASHSIEHLVSEELIETLENIIRALKPNGRFLIEVPHGGHSYLRLSARQDPHTLFFTPQSIVAAVRRSGGRVLYRKAFAKEPIPKREDPIYIPSGDNFNNTDRGSLTIVCERRS